MLSEKFDSCPDDKECAATSPSPQVSPFLTRAAELRAKAQRYRALAEGLFDLKLVAVVQACAQELEAEAASVEFMASPRTGGVSRAA
jgi:hypothetical protein